MRSVTVIEVQNVDRHWAVSQVNSALQSCFALPFRHWDTSSLNRIRECTGNVCAKASLCPVECLYYFRFQKVSNSENYLFCRLTAIELPFSPSPDPLY